MVGEDRQERRHRYGHDGDGRNMEAEVDEAVEDDCVDSDKRPKRAPAKLRIAMPFDCPEPLAEQDDDEKDCDGELKCAPLDPELEEIVVSIVVSFQEGVAGLARRRFDLDEGSPAG